MNVIVVILTALISMGVCSVSDIPADWSIVEGPCVSPSEAPEEWGLVIVVTLADGCEYYLPPGVPIVSPEAYDDR